MTGTPFNIGIKTLTNELLEADGRTAGGLATLRFRPLAGERRNIAALAYDAHKLGKQVERLSAVLDAAPLPVWLRGADGKLVWVNQAYVASVEAPDGDVVVKAGIEIASRASLDKRRANAETGCVGRIHAVIGGAMRALDIFEVALAGRQGGLCHRHDGAGGGRKGTRPPHQGAYLDPQQARHGDCHFRTRPAPALSQRGLCRALAARFELARHPSDRWRNPRPAAHASAAFPNRPITANGGRKQLSAYTTLEMRESWWYLPDGRSLHVVCEQHPFGGVTYLYENVTKEIQLESRYNELIGVQRETLDNLEEGIALLGSDGRLKLFNPAFARFWNLDPGFLETEPHIEELAAAWPPSSSPTRLPGTK